MSQDGGVRVGHYSYPCSCAGRGVTAAVQPAETREGLRELVVQLDGRAARKAPARLAGISCLTQLDRLQLDGIGHNADGKHLGAALRLLTGLTRLSLRFVFDDMSDDADRNKGTPASCSPGLRSAG